jgi:hypothetical protein
VAKASFSLIPNVALVRADVQVKDSITQMYTCSSAARPEKLNPA